MFIEKAFSAQHEFWRYVIGVIAVFFAMSLAQLPWMFALMLEGGMEAMEMEPAEMLGLLESNLNLFLILFPFLVSLVVLFLIIKYLHQQKIKDVTTARKKIDWGRVFFGFAIIAVLTVIMTGVDYYFNPEAYLLNFKLVPFLILCVIAIALIPVQTSFEEYLFRGYLMQGFGTASTNRNFPLWAVFVLFVILSYALMMAFFSMGLVFHLSLWLFYGLAFILLMTTGFHEIFAKTQIHKVLYGILKRKSTPLFVTSIIFGSMHFFNPEVGKLGNIIMVYYIGTGFFLGIITLMDEGMELALGFHAGNNLVTALLVTADWTAFQTHSVLKDVSDPTAGFDVILPMLIFYAVFLVILALKYKWRNWRGKLFGKIELPEEQVVLGKH